MSGPGWRVRWTGRLQFAEQVLLASLAGAMAVLACWQIVLRNLGRGGAAWINPFLGASMLWITLLGALAATGRRKHIAVDLLAHGLPPLARRGMRIVTDLAGAVVCGFLCEAAVRFTALQREMGGEAFPGVSQWAIYCILPAGFGLMALRYATHALLACLPGGAEGVRA